MTTVPTSENMDGHWIIRFDYSGALHHIFNGQSGRCAFWDAVVAFWALKKRHECWINVELPILLLHFTDKPSESSKTSTILPSSLSFIAVACAFPPTNSECSCLSLSGRFGFWFCWMNTSRSQAILFWFLKKLHYFRQKFKKPLKLI